MKKELQGASKKYVCGGGGKGVLKKQTKTNEQEEQGSNLKDCLIF